MEIPIVRNSGDPEKGAGAANLTEGQEPENFEPEPPDGLEYTGIRNAQRFVEVFGVDVRFVKPWGAWFVWAGKRWAQDSTGQIVELAKRVVLMMFEEAAMLGDEKLLKWAKQSASEGRLTEMVSLAESDPRVVAKPSDFDSRPYMLNVENGMLNLRDGSIRPHERTDMMASMVNVTYIPAARDPLWTAFVKRALPDEDVRAYVQKVMGSALAGNPVDQRLYFVYGPEASGKSTLLNSVRTVLGEYGYALDSESLLKKSGDAGVRNDLAALSGKRYVMTTEPTEGKRWDTARIKQMTGGDPITARKLFHEPFEFVPLFVLFVASNTQPAVPSSDGAFWRRMREIPFDQTIPEGERDKMLSMRLREPDVQTAILSWLVEGCLAWQKEPVLSEPKAVLKATDEYRANNDTMQAWFTSCLTVMPGAQERSATLRGSYEQWCKDNGEKPEPGGAKAWGNGLRRLGLRPVGTKATRAWTGAVIRRGRDA